MTIHRRNSYFNMKELKSMRVLRLFALIVLATIVQGCATRTGYVVPDNDPDVAYVAPISERRSFADWDRLTIRAIDDKFVSDFPYHPGLPISPGPKRLLVHVAFNRGLLSGGPYSALVPIAIVLEPRKQYELKSQTKDNLVEIWLEERDGDNRALSTASGPFQVQPIAIPLFIPIGR